MKSGSEVNRIKGVSAYNKILGSNPPMPTNVALAEMVQRCAEDAGHLYIGSIPIGHTKGKVAQRSQTVMHYWKKALI